MSFSRPDPRRSGLLNPLLTCTSPSSGPGRFSWYAERWCNFMMINKHVPNLYYYHYIAKLNYNRFQSILLHHYITVSGDGMSV